MNSRKIKYSILMPYYDRAEQFKKTLDKFNGLYKNRTNYEVIVIEDYKNKLSETLHKELLDLCKDYSFVHVIDGPDEITYNPSKLYNFGADFANGDFFILTSPECYHGSFVLDSLDKVHCLEGWYAICACKSIDSNGNHKKWYQHSIHRNAEFHFCSCIWSKDFFRIGGFDEDFAYGYCFDDDAFRDRVKLAGIDFLYLDGEIVYHQDHKKHNVPNRQKLWDRNRKLWLKKYGSKGCNSGDGETYGANA